MLSSELTPMQQAYQEIPERWYEHGESSNLLAKIISYPLTCAYAGVLLSGNDSLAYHLIGAGVFIASVVSDRITTARGFNAINRAAIYGISVDHGEGNPHLQGVTTSRELNFHPKMLLIDLLFTAASLTLPNIAAYFSVGKFTASLSNLSIARRYDRAAQIATSNLDTNNVQPSPILL